MGAWRKLKLIGNKLTYFRTRNCQTCDGKGGQNVAKCTKCKGRGQV